MFKLCKQHLRDPYKRKIDQKRPNRFLSMGSNSFVNNIPVPEFACCILKWTRIRWYILTFIQTYTLRIFFLPRCHACKWTPRKSWLATSPNGARRQSMAWMGARLRQCKGWFKKCLGESMLSYKMSHRLFNIKEPMRYGRDLRHKMGSRFN